MTVLLDFYRRHTPVTDPGVHADALRQLPRDVPALVEVIGGIFAHYEFDIPGSGFTPPPGRLAEVDLRATVPILDRVFELDPGPLAQPRPMSQRYLGVCRDASLLLCSILRTHGIPARLRYGTCHHLFVPRRPLHDHVVVEYWSEAEGRWKYGDGRMYSSVRRAYKLPDKYRDDIPQELFLTGAQAWLRSQNSDAAAFTMSGFMLDADAGRWQARNLFMYDLASLYGWEPMMWDAWGYIKRAKVRSRPCGPLQHRKLNRLAALEPRDPAQWLELMRAYRKMRLVRLTSTVLSCSPVNGRSSVTALTARKVSHALD